MTDSAHQTPVSPSSELNPSHITPPESGVDPVHFEWFLMEQILSATIEDLSEQLCDLLDDLDDDQFLGLVVAVGVIPIERLREEPEMGRLMEATRRSQKPASLKVAKKLIQRLRRLHQDYKRKTVPEPSANEADKGTTFCPDALIREDTTSEQIKPKGDTSRDPAMGEKLPEKSPVKESVPEQLCLEEEGRDSSADSSERNRDSAGQDGKSRRINTDASIAPEGKLHQGPLGEKIDSRGFSLGEPLQTPTLQTSPGLASARPSQANPTPPKRTTFTPPPRNRPRKKDMSDTIRQRYLRQLVQPEDSPLTQCELQDLFCVYRDYSDFVADLARETFLTQEQILLGHQLEEAFNTLRLSNDRLFSGTTASTAFDCINQTFAKWQWEENLKTKPPPEVSEKSDSKTTAESYKTAGTPRKDSNLPSGQTSLPNVSKFLDLNRNQRNQVLRDFFLEGGPDVDAHRWVRTIPMGIGLLREVERWLDFPPRKLLDQSILASAATDLIRSNNADEIKENWELVYTTIQPRILLKDPPTAEEMALSVLGCPTGKAESSKTMIRLLRRCSDARHALVLLETGLKLEPMSLQRNTELAMQMTKVRKQGEGPEVIKLWADLKFHIWEEMSKEK